MRRLGAMVFANQGRRGGGAISYFQCVIVDLSLEPGMIQNKTRLNMRINHLMPFFFFLSSQISRGLDATTLLSAAWQHLAGCHLSLFSATTVSLLRSCLTSFSVALPSASLLQNKRLCTGKDVLPRPRVGPDLAS